MTNRELFHATMRRENGDCLLHVIQGFYPRVEDWQTQGLPSTVVQPPFYGVSATPDLFDHCNVTRFAFCGFSQHYVPAFATQVIEEGQGRRVERNSLGNIVETRIDDGVSLPHEIDFALKDRAGYEAVRDRLLGQLEQRAPRRELAKMGAVLRNQQDHLVSLWVHGPSAGLRDLLGVEKAITVPHGDTDWTRLILDDHLQVSMEAGVRVIEACGSDLCYVWEDCCSRSGPMVSPSAFCGFHIPWYPAWRSFLCDIGVPWIVLDTDGDPTPLVWTPHAQIRHAQAGAPAAPPVNQPVVRHPGGGCRSAGQAHLFLEATSGHGGRAV